MQPASTVSHKHHSRRIEDALNRLIQSILPISASSDDGTSDDSDNPAREADARRNRRALRRAHEILDNYREDEDGVPGSAVLIGASPEVVNSAPDMIKRKLVKEHPSPDKAARFSNLYSRLLTQPVLSQKWAILYLLYRIGQVEDEPVAVGGVGARGGPRQDGRRSPLLQEHQLESMLLKDRMSGRRTVADSIAPGSSISAAGRESPFHPPPFYDTGRRMSTRDFVQSRQTEGPRSLDDRTNGQVRLSMPQPHVETIVHNIIPQEKPKPEPQSQSPEPNREAEPPPTEEDILKDLPFNLQGISSANLYFVSSSLVKLPRSLPIPVLSLLNTLAEPCLLYRDLATFLEQNDGGLIHQGLRAAISNELRSYLGLVAIIEGEIRGAVVALAEPTDRIKIITLKRCVVLMRDSTMALRLMSLIVEEAKGKKGGQLISMIRGFSSAHGDPFVAAFAERLLVHVTHPFYGMLTQWIYEGELSDPYREFFVVEPETRPATDLRRVATSVWDDKYKLDDDMVPSIMTHEFAKKVFLIGKSLNFIRHGCGDLAWVIAYSKDNCKELRYGDIATLETSIDEAYKTTMARLIYLMDSKFKLFDHLLALKKYLLLGQGDFIALLMESLASNLDRPANSQYRHTLTAQLEHAIRSSNAQYDSSDVLRRLDARMLELSHGETGWDCFTLEYKIDAPVDVVITPWGSRQYLKVFNFLWRVKRVEFALGSTWRRYMTGARGVLGMVDDKVGKDWKRVQCVISEMIHFIGQLQYYILYEVIESSWDELQVAVHKPDCTLDDIIEAHTRYLDSITHKGLLGSSSSRVSSKSSTKEDFLSQLHHILKLMLAYKDVVDGLYSFSVAEFTHRQELSAKNETRTAQGRWDLTDRDVAPSSRLSRRANTTSSSAAASLFTSHKPSRSESRTPLIRLDDEDAAAVADASDSNDMDGNRIQKEEDHLLPALRTRLRELSRDFRARIVTLLSDLAYQPDTDMRTLGMVMNFNDVYPVRRRRTTTAAASSNNGAGNGAGTTVVNGVSSSSGAGLVKERGGRHGSVHQSHGYGHQDFGHSHMQAHSGSLRGRFGTLGPLNSSSQSELEQSQNHKYMREQVVQEQGPGQAQTQMQMPGQEEDPQTSFSSMTRKG